MPRGFHFFAVALSLFLAACFSPARAQPATMVIDPATFSAPTITPAPSITPTLTPAVTPTPTLLPTLTPTPACAETNGTLVDDALNSSILNREIPLRVYLPPCYETQTWRSYPALYLIHGLWMDESAWDEIGADEAADALIAKGDIPPLIIVMPRAPDNSRFADAVASELVPLIDANYRTLADRDHRAVGGMSRGGGWSVRIGFQHPDVFGAVGLHSAAVFYADETQVSGWMNDLAKGDAPRIYMDIGENDSLLQSVQWLDEALTQRNIEHEFHLNSGGHSDGYWQKHLPEYLRWYTGAWQP